MEPLRENEVASLNWSSPFSFSGMVRIGTIGGGSCFFHAVFSAFYTPYIEGKIGRMPFSASEFISKIRNELSAEISPLDLQTLEGWQPDELELEQMKIYLSSSMPIDRRFFEYLSKKLSKDILILDGDVEDVLLLGDPNLLYLGSPRKSIVLLRISDHFEVVGIRENFSKGNPMLGFPNIRTEFESNDPFCKAILSRMKEKFSLASYS
ncbi:hypothetical protein pv_3 [Pithovirus sibericum]|uniref:Uncharacterized protein n=1 Tax=Pithovirus sibericum TaxID=1450746 RepID=W5S9X4_9VIRU|nr:hypothetical protein pv_3 [Pithovirus sibericum]AHH01570.1 hypothetical protein pv_3 [Pithovirus sibericum]